MSQQLSSVGLASPLLSWGVRVGETAVPIFGNLATVISPSLAETLLTPMRLDYPMTYPLDPMSVL